MFSAQIYENNKPNKKCKEKIKKKDTKYFGNYLVVGVVFIIQDL